MGVVYSTGQITKIGHSTYKIVSSAYTYMNYQRSLLVYDRDTIGYINIYDQQYMMPSGVIEHGLLRNPRFIAGKLIGFQMGNVIAVTM